FFAISGKRTETFPNNKCFKEVRPISVGEAKIEKTLDGIESRQLGHMLLQVCTDLRSGGLRGLFGEPGHRKDYNGQLSFKFLSCLLKSDLVLRYNSLV